MASNLTVNGTLSAGSFQGNGAGLSGVPGTLQWQTAAATTQSAAANMGVGLIYTSTDSGVKWTARDSKRSWTSVASSADGTKLIAAAMNGQIYTSTPSVTTTPGTSGHLTGGQGTSVELQYTGNGVFMLIGHEGTVKGY